MGVIMKLLWLVVLAAIGAVLVVSGVALVYPPAAFIVAGSICLGLAFVVEVRE